MQVSPSVGFEAGKPLGDSVNIGPIHIYCSSTAGLACDPWEPRCIPGFPPKTLLETYNQKTVFLSILFVSVFRFWPVTFVVFLLPYLPFAWDEAFYSFTVSFHSDSFGRNYSRCGVIGGRTESCIPWAAGRIMKDLMSSICFMKIQKQFEAVFPEPI